MRRVVWGERRGGQRLEGVGKVKWGERRLERRERVWERREERPEAAGCGERSVGRIV